jgi:hypothetical protein
VEETYKLKRVRVWKLTLVGLILGLFFGLLAGLIAALMGDTFISLVGALFSISPETLTSLPKMIWIVSAIIGALGGALGTFIGTIIFNMCIAIVGGVELQLDDESHAALSAPVIIQQPQFTQVPTPLTQPQLPPAVNQIPMSNQQIPQNNINQPK